MIERRIDDLGRVHIPEEIRQSLTLKEGEVVEIYEDDNTLCIRKKVNTQFDRIKAMSIDEMAEGITKMLCAHLNKFNTALGNELQILTAEEMSEAIQEWKQWLESEVQE